MDCSPPGSSVHGILQARILEWVAIPFSRGSSQPRDWTQVSRIAGGFLPTEPKGKPKKTGVGSLSLLQGIFLAQGSNPGLPQGRQILYHLSHQGSTVALLVMAKNWEKILYQLMNELNNVICPSIMLRSITLIEKNRYKDHIWYKSIYMILSKMLSCNSITYTSFVHSDAS